MIYRGPLNIFLNHTIISGPSSIVLKPNNCTAVNEVTRRAPEPLYLTYNCTMAPQAFYLKHIIVHRHLNNFT